MTTKSNGAATAAGANSCPYPFATVEDAQQELHATLRHLWSLPDGELHHAMLALTGMALMMTNEEAFEAVTDEPKKEMVYYLVEKVDQEVTRIRALLEHAFCVSVIVEENSLSALNDKPHLLKFARTHGPALCQAKAEDPHEGWLAEAERLRGAKLAEKDPRRAQLADYEAKLASSRATTPAGIRAQLRFALGRTPAEGATLGKLEAAALGAAMDSLAVLNAAQAGKE